MFIYKLGGVLFHCPLTHSLGSKVYSNWQGINYPYSKKKKSNNDFQVMWGKKLNWSHSPTNSLLHTELQETENGAQLWTSVLRKSTFLTKTPKVTAAISDKLAL